MNYIINLSKATLETHAFQNDSQFQELTKSCAIDKSAFELLLNQPDVVKIRTYFGLDSNNKLGIVVVGVDAQNNDITAGIILGDSIHCPYHCANNSPLMK